MEITDQPTQENPETAASDYQEPSQIMPYECNFCKRGFSNAQALGGHMNIHRKDKAKLKQSSSASSNIGTQVQQQSSLDIPTMPTSYSPNPTKLSDHHQEIRSINQWRPWVLGKDHVQATEKELPLMFSQIVQSDSEEKKGLEKLDLELRLGPEPAAGDSSGATTGTKKKF